MLVILGHNSELHLSLCLRRHNFDVSSLQRNKELLQYLPPIKLSVCTAVICSTLTRISLEGADLIGVPSRFV